MPKIVDIGRAERFGELIRFKEKGTLERHDVGLEDVEKLLVRVAPRPDKYILADFFTAEAVYRVNQEKTVIDYRSFLEDVELSGIENFRKFVAVCAEELPEERRDGATVEFGAGGPPEAFASKEEFIAYENAITSGGKLPPRPTNGSGEIDLSEIHDKKKKAEAIWREYGDDLQEAERMESTSPLLSRNMSVILIFIGFLISAGGVGATLKWMFSDKTNDVETQVTFGILAVVGLCILIGVMFMVAGLLVYRRAVEAET